MGSQGTQPTVVKKPGSREASTRANPTAKMAAINSIGIPSNNMGIREPPKVYYSKNELDDKFDMNKYDLNKFDLNKYDLKSQLPS